MYNWYWVVIAMFVIGMALFVCGLIARKNDDWEIRGTARIVAGVVILFMTFICFIASFFGRLDAKAEVEEHKHRYEFVMQTIENAEKYKFANVEITQTILEYNEWLNKAQARKATCGRWTVYYDLPVEELHYIGIEDTEK